MKKREFYRGEDWEEQRKKCLKRDKNRCRICKRFTNKVHHIIKFSVSHNNSLSNLISFCDKHHTQMENKYRTIGNTHYVKQLILENARMEIDMIKRRE